MGDDKFNVETKNKDIIGLLDGAIDQIEQEKGSIEKTGRKLSELEQDQVHLMNLAVDNIRKARQEIFQAYCGGSDNSGQNDDWDLDQWLVA